jgi:hypothetical protein
LAVVTGSYTQEYLRMRQAENVRAIGQLGFIRHE